ncbi:MAG: methionine--tRNA ligase subunit beta [Thermoprotei archaeon]
MSEEISIEEFMKVDLRIGVIKNVEKIPGSEKLYKIIVDLGELGERQIVAGIAKWYKPEDLIGKNIVVVANLKPKKIFGEISQGMLLAADVDGEPVLLTTVKPVKPGARVR